MDILRCDRANTREINGSADAGLLLGADYLGGWDAA